jgi:hypothetical protein
VVPLRAFIRAQLFALLVVLLSSVAFAQNAQLSGQVRDASGAAVVDAVLKIENQATNFAWEVRSNGDGVYLLPSLPPGDYRIAVSASGFQPREVRDLRLEVAGKSALNFVLTVDGEKQTVTVSASGMQIDTTDAAISTVVDQKFVENIPLNGRSFQSLLTAIPGVQVVPSTQGQGYGGEMSVNGMRTESNYYMVDGVSMNTGVAASTPGWGGGYSGATPSQTVLGTTQNLISIEALRELRATTSTYSAEYGRTPGGQFSFSSRSGANQWHGGAFDYFRNDLLDSNDTFSRRASIARPRTRQNDFGGTFSGPVLVPRFYDGHDRTFFFASYEGLQLTAPQSAATTAVPSSTMRANAVDALKRFLQAFPVSSGAEDATTGFSSFVSGYSNPSSLKSFSIRGDHSFSDNLKWFARYSWSNSASQTRSTNDLANVTDAKGSMQSGTTGLTWLLTPRLTNDLRFNATYNKQSNLSYIDNFGGASSLSMAGLSGYSGTTQDWLDFYLYYDLQPYFTYGLKSVGQKQINIVDTMSRSLGRHSLKWGVDYRRLHSERANPPLYSFPMYFSLEEVNANAPGYSAVEKFNGNISPVYQNFSAFLQDEWKLSPRLSVSAGVRWDVNPAPNDASGNQPAVTTQISDLSTTVLSAKGSSLWKTRWSNVSPRLGFAYQIRRAPGHETVLRAGFGSFYDLGTATGSMGYFGVGIAAINRGSGVAFPFNQAAVDAVKPSLAAPYNFSVYTFDPNLKTPYSWQWNASLEQGVGEGRTVTVSYVASLGRDLLYNHVVQPELLGNTAFSGAWGLYITNNASSSTYNAMQLKYQQSVFHGLLILASYTWAHAQDDNTSNFTSDYLQRADSNYDIRHNAQVTLSYALPALGHGLVRSVTSNWGADSRISIRTALPVDITTGNSIQVNGASVSPHPNYVAGQPLYIKDATLPGGRRINFDAFEEATDASGNRIEGNFRRNFARAFGSAQTDLSLRREFHIAAGVGVQFRMEAFNLFNRINLGSIYDQLSYGESNFGRAYSLQSSQLGGLNSLYQTGGPRSLQAAIKLSF